MGRLLDEQPDSSVRRPADADEVKRRAQDHAQTTDAPRWGPPGKSVEERGHPREGGEPPAERQRRVANPPEKEGSKD